MFPPTFALTSPPAVIVKFYCVYKASRFPPSKQVIKLITQCAECVVDYFLSQTDLLYGVLRSSIISRNGHRHTVAASYL